MLWILLRPMACFCHRPNTFTRHSVTARGRTLPARRGRLGEVVLALKRHRKQANRRFLWSITSLWITDQEFYLYPFSQAVAVSGTTSEPDNPVCFRLGNPISLGPASFAGLQLLSVWKLRRRYVTYSLWRLIYITSYIYFVILLLTYMYIFTPIYMI